MRQSGRLVGLVAWAWLAGAAVAQAPDPRLWAELRWRMIGPHRGGRTVAAVGVPGRPDVFYIGVNNGGVWKSDDYGRVWTPIFDDQPTGSIGALAVAPSDPRVIYVGTGEGLQRPDLSTGNGVYKSTDAGGTWTHLGLGDAQQIAAIAVDPRDPQRLFVAALGHPYGPNRERGVYRSLDGGRSFQQVLFKDENTGAFEVLLDPHDPGTLYAALWAGRQPPWESSGGSWQLPGASGLHKSTDGGTSWRELTRGLPRPEQGRGRIGLAVAPSAQGRLFALVDATSGAGLYRSDDAGESFNLVNAEERLWGRGQDFAELKVDPKNADTLYVGNIAAWKSTDAGQSFSGWRGAPGGDDYHRIWIHPDDPQIILLAADQGAIVTVNGGRTFSSWYNQPTAQLFHVNADDAFPYRVCGGQQESGSVCISSRGDDGQITFREWHPAAVEEYGYAVPDPLDPDVVYGGRLTRWDRRTGQVQNVAPKALREPGYRVVRTQPSVFSAKDPQALYYASNVLWRTRDGGQSWAQLSPDLTRESYATPDNLGAFTAQDPEKGKHRGVIYTIAPSPLEAGLIWVGNDDGLIHVTRDDGRSWTNVTPRELAPWAKISILEASHFDRDTAYAAVNTFRLDDLRPHVYRTRDGGRSWTRIVAGLPDGAVVNVVREDPRKRGLLFAGSELAVYVSFDDGEHWASLRQNMPATSIRDLIVKGDDLVVATHGRSFWILDDISPLRQLDARSALPDVRLFEPQLATRVRWNQNTDTPLPQEEPAGQNPPDGAILDYYLKADVAGPVTLELLDERGRVLRRFSSDDPLETPKDHGNVPAYWVRPPQPLSARAGAHRFVWDLHEQPPRGLEVEYPIAAIYGNTPPVPQGPWVPPGRYQVRLTVAGRALTQPLEVRMDPRVRASQADLLRQHELSRRLLAGLERAASAAAAQSVAPGPAAGETPSRLERQLGQLYESVQGVDAAPTPVTASAAEERLAALERLLQAQPAR